MRKWLGWAFLGGVAVFSSASGCGGGGSDTGPGFGDDDDGAAPASDASGGGQDATSTNDASGPHLDATTGGDTSTGPVDGSGGLDISIPDGGFASPDASGGGGDSGGDSSTVGCGPDSYTCNGNVATICNGGVSSMQTCSGTTATCANGYGCVACQPGSATCSGSTSVVCKSDGSGTTSTVCDSSLGETCTNGYCAGDCANVGTSYIGCEYYAVTMSNSELNQSVFAFSVSVSNTSSTTATVTISGPAGFTGGGTIAAQSIVQYTLPWVPALSCGGGGCTGFLANAGGTVKVAGGAYHIKSTEPVVVYQFNPRDYQENVTCASDGTSPPCHSFTNDASLLLPVNAMTGNYVVVAGATWDFPSDTAYEFPGNVAIVGTVDGTSVTYTAPAGNAIQAGAGLSTTTGTVTLNHGDVLQVAAALNGTATAFGSDQSGAIVTATQPVEVFGGVDCTYMPTTVPACDHLEEIIFPLETLRSDYLVALPTNQNGTPAQYIKIVGTAAGTTLTYDPAIAGAPATIGAGQSSFFHVTQNFRVTSSHPIIVGQFMESENNFTASATAGDPASSVAIPQAQYRASYQFVAPPSYQQNWVNIIAPTGSTITVDGTAYTSGTNIGASSGYWTKPVSLCAGTGCTGVHTATGTAGFGIQVYGYGEYTSYMYPGGLNLTRQ